MYLYAYGIGGGGKGRGAPPVLEKSRGGINKGETGGNGEREKGFQIKTSSNPPPPPFWELGVIA